MTSATISSKNMLLDALNSELNDRINYHLIRKTFNSLPVTGNGRAEYAQDLSEYGDVCNGFFASISGGPVVQQLYNGIINNYTISFLNVSNNAITISGTVFYLVNVGS